MSTGLPSSVVDVFLSVLNQVPGKHSGVQGRLTNLIDCIVKKYVGPGQADERVVVEAREAFQALASTSRDVTNGNPDSLNWSAPKLLAGLDRQLVSVCEDVPRVYADDGSTWSGYPDVRILTDKLTQDVYHTSDHTIQVPDGAQIGDSTGMAWTETGYDQAGKPITSSWFGVRSNLGTWVLSPRQLYAPANTSIRCMAKVVSDGTFFWLFWNDEASGFGLNVAVITEQGQQLATTRLTQVWQNTPGYWDVTVQGGTVLLAQPGAYNPPNNVGVKLTKFAYATGTITPTSNTDATMKCNGGVAWLTNDADPSHAWLGTLANGVPDNFYKLLGYQVNVGTLASLHEYDSGQNLPVAPDSITGWSVQDGPNFDCNLVWSMLSWSGQVHGPVFDPAMRNVNTVNVTFGGLVTTVRVTQSVLLVSRAFQRDGMYVAYTYYQSGSGLVLTATPLTVTITEGDYMIGSGSQVVNVQGGDYTTGGPIPGSTRNFITVTVGLGTQNVMSGDNVSVWTVIAGDPLNSGTAAIPVGTQVLRWTLANIPGTGQPYGMSALQFTGTSIPGANSGTFFVIPSSGATPANTVYTKLTSSTGANPVPGTFTTLGTFVVNPNALYPITNLASLITPETAGFYPGGSLVISGATGTGNNGTFTTSMVQLSSSVNVNNAIWCNPNFGQCLVAQATTQTTSPFVGFSFVVSPQSPYTWHFARLIADSSYDGTTLVVSGAGPTNDGTFTVTGHAGGNFQTTGTDAAATQAQLFGIPSPSVTVDIPLSQTPYTFFLQSVSTDYRYLGAFLSLTNSNTPDNDGTYKITWLDPSNAHTFVAVPTNGRTDQVNEAFGGDLPPTIVIQFQNSQQPEFQPVWFITPLEAQWPQVGCFERGLAYADWRFEGETVYPGPNTFPLGLSSPFLAESVHSIILPYRAKSFTAGETVTTPTGTVTSLVTETNESTVGLKRFQLQNTNGQATEAYQELVLPGPVGGGFTSSGFHEQGVNLGPETPFLVAVEHDATAIGVTPGEIQVKVTYEWMDDNGERGYSYPSPPLVFNLLAPNNTYTVGGRLPLPLDGSGNNVPSVYGITNRRIVSICIYRTCTIQGIPTTQLYKVTNDLNQNGLYNGSGMAGSGFVFPNSYTWYYRDQSLDAAVVNQETLYTSKGQLPRYPAPPCSQGVTWENRSWLVGYDKAVWCSGDKQDGDGNWFFPGFRLTLGEDEPVSVAKMEQYLVIGGKRRMWYIPAQGFPNNTGSSGSLPLPSPLPFPNGSTGYVATLNSGTAYSSTAGGVWLVTRDLKNLWLSEPVKDDLGPVTGLAVDQNQRLAVTDGSSVLFVYDTVTTAWYKWNLPSSVVKLCTWQGQFAYQDTAGVLRQVPGQYLDTYSGGNHAIAPDLTMAGMSFAQARAVKRVREMQLIGEYKGPHKLNAVMTYPDDFNQEPTNFGPYSPDPTKPYLIAVNPKIEEAGQFGLRVYASFEGIATPGNSFSLELISCEVGLDRRQGIMKLPTAQRITGR